MPFTFILASVTPFGFIFIGLSLFSIFIAHRWLKRNSDKPGCVSLIVATIVVNFVLLFPVMFSYSFFESGTTEIKIGVGIFWLLIFGLGIYITRSKNYKLLKNIFITILAVIFGSLFLILYGGMIYFVYQRFFTHQQDGAPNWAVMLCITFVAVLTLTIVGLLIKKKKVIKAEETTYKNLNPSEVEADLVYNLDLSNQNLTELPRIVLSYKNLRTLNLSNNRITQLPIEIRFLSQLNTITLSNNPINDQQRADIRKLFSFSVDIIFRS